MLWCCTWEVILFPYTVSEAHIALEIHDIERDSTEIQYLQEGVRLTPRDCLAGATQILLWGSQSISDLLTRSTSSKYSININQPQERRGIGKQKPDRRISHGNRETRGNSRLISVIDWRDENNGIGLGAMIFRDDPFSSPSHDLSSACNERKGGNWEIFFLV